MSNANENKLSQIIDIAKNAGATQVEAILFDNLSVGVSCRQNKVDEIEQNKSYAFGVRVLVGNRQAFVASSDDTKGALRETVQRAVEMAKITPSDDFIGLPEPEEFVSRLEALDLCDENFPTIENLISDALEIEDTACSYGGITNSNGASCGYSLSKVYFANSHGLMLDSKSSTYSKSVSCIAGENIRMETDYDYSVARKYSELRANSEVADLAAKRTIAKLGAKKIASTKIAIIFEPRIASKFVGSFASFANGQSFVLGTSFLKDYFGLHIFSKNISIIDDPFIIGGLGSRQFDSEGVAARKNYLVRNGKFETCLLDTYHARKLGMKTTGSARRDLNSPTHPGPSNLYLENGNVSVSDLLRSVDRAIVVNSTFSSNTNSLTGDISQGFSGFYYEKGELQHPVSELSFAGNLLEFYKNLIPANDLKFEGIVNSPSIFIPAVTVAGR
jgi:PmbA protein